MKHARMETGFDDRSILCQTGRHDECSGEPPSEKVRPFVPIALRDRACSCPCHRTRVRAERNPRHGVDGGAEEVYDEARNEERSRK